jgi:acyl-CoA reductase-like NAD-dependent aldehyde dehydrogenase
MAGFTLTINGKGVGSPGALDVINPATGEVFAQVPDCTQGQLDDAMHAAQHAFAGWRDDLEYRREVLLAASEAVSANAERLARLETQEQGMPLAGSLARVRNAARVFASFAELELPAVTVLQDDDVAHIEAVRKPLGVIMVITAWNGPIIQGVHNIAAAFWTGNTVVLKPSPFTPVGTLALGEVLRDVVPPGVLNTIAGADPLGQWAVEHPVPRGVSFTGSIPTGKKVNAAAAADLKRVLLELGGNDPLIALDDIDPAKFAEQVFSIAFRNSGQVCQAPKRVYVPTAKYDAVVAAMAEVARGAVLGDGLDASTQYGPVSNKVQFERVKELYDDSMAHGAVAAAGGHALDRPGYFFEPTILAGISDGVRVVDEEQFGPLLPVIRYDDLDKVIETVNSSMYGLGASVWSGDLARARAVGVRIESGSVWINTHAEQNGIAPFGGVKWSGVGRRNAMWSLEAFTDVQSVWTAKA